ncbi:hypothetical protein [Ferrimonas sp.]|uniref:hypothetical protein n=1 Tax=Ferrimonas sp. TaxID=2080861 RepID=UPI003A94923A
MDKKGLIRRLFAGDVSLPVTFWLFGGLVAAVGGRLFAWTVEENTLAIVTSEYGLTMVTGLSWLFRGYLVFILIAIWRSAGNYTGSTSWTVLARIVVLMNAVSLADVLLSDRISEAQLEEQVVALKEKLPAMVDDDTQLDDVILTSGTVDYVYSLVDYTSDDVDSKQFHDAITPLLIEGTCQSAQSMTILNTGRALTYWYYGTDDGLIAEVSVVAKDCRDFKA